MIRFSRLITSLGMLCGSFLLFSFTPVQAQTCPELITPGGPYQIDEGKAVSFAAEVAPSEQPFTSFQWGIGTCWLGEGTGLTAERNAENGLQHCLIQELGTDGTNQLYPNSIQYRAQNESCLLTGSVDMELRNTPPEVEILTTCHDGAISGELPVDVYASDPAEFDHDLPALLIGKSSEDTFTIGETTIGTGGNASFLVDTTTLPDSNNFTFELQVEDDEGTTKDLLTNCTIDNNPPELPSSDLTVTQEKNLQIDLSEASDAGAGIDTFEVRYQDSLIERANGNETTLEVDWFSLINAGIDQCEDNDDIIFADLTVKAIDEVGLSTTTTFPLTITCTTTDDQDNENEDDNEENDTGGEETDDNAPSSSINITDSLTDRSTDDTQTTTRPSLPSFIPAFDQPPAERVNQYISFCQELPNICPHGRTGSPASSFPDTQNHRSAGYVDAFRATCGVKGKGDTGRFYPDDLVTNGEAVKMGVTAIPMGNVYQQGGETDYQGPTYFPDVPTQEWSAPYWAYAQQNNWLNGIANEGQPVDPYQPMPRSTAIRLLMNIYADTAQLDLQQFATDAFNDISPEHPDYHHIAAAYQLNVVQGKQIEGQRLFDPDAGVTRAEFSKMATQLFTPFFNWCGVPNNVDRLKGVQAQREDLDQEAQQEAFVTTKNEIATSSAQDLELQGVAQGGLMHALSTVTQNETNELMKRANETLTGIGSIAREGPCPPELLAQLKELQAALEAQAEKLEKQVADTNNDCNDHQNKLDQLDKEIDELTKQKEDKEKEVEEKENKLDELEKQLDNIDNQLDEKRKRVQDLQDLLTNDENVTQHKGDKPLADVEAGAALSFDGGETWIVAHGEGGVETYLETSENSEGIMDELRDLEKEIRNLKQQQEDAKQEKEDTQEELDDAKQEQQEINDKLDKKKQERTDTQQQLKECNKELKELGQQIARLNAKIDEFNKAAKRCGIQARRAYNEARDKLDKMPPDEREEAEEQFEDGLTQEEKEATDNPDEDVTAGGGGLSEAADKLEDAMRAASACPPPETKEGDWTRVEGSYKEETIQGADRVEIVNAKGTRGLDDQTTQEIFNDILLGLDIIGGLSTEQSKFDLFLDKNPVSLLYGFFQSAAQDAITDKLDQRIENRTLQGYPQRVEVSIGPVWSFLISGREEKQPVYQCVEGIWQLEHHNYQTIEEIGECTYQGGPYTYRKNFTELELDTTGCTMGSCPAAWKDAMKKAINAAKKEHAGGGIISPCEDVVNLLLD